MLEKKYRIDMLNDSILTVKIFGIYYILATWKTYQFLKTKSYEIWTI